MLDEIRQKSKYILESHKDMDIIDQLGLLKTNLGINDEQSTLLHSEYFDNSWNKNISKLVESFIKVLPKKILTESLTKKPQIKPGDRVIINRLVSVTEPEKKIKGKVKNVIESIKFEGKVYDVETSKGLIVLTPLDDYILESEHNKEFLKKYSKSLVKARFEKPGNWLTPSKIFILYITPMGTIVDMRRSSNISPTELPFEVEGKVTMGDLYDFERNSEYDLSVNGKINESLKLVKEQDEDEEDEDRVLDPEKYEFFNFPTGWDDESIDEVMSEIPSIFTVEALFRIWGKMGFDFSHLKLIDLPDTTAIRLILLKKYMESTNNPIPVEFTFKCRHLSDLFKEYRNYDTSFVKKFLCGEDPFDNEWWYTFDYQDDMLDMVDAKNMETISKILGVENSNEKERNTIITNILDEDPTDEYESEIIDNKGDTIDEIKYKIVRSYSIEYEDAVKRDMYDHVIDSLKNHLWGGELIRNSYDGKYSYTMKGDLRDFISEGDWDDEDYFQNHPDYSGSISEIILHSWGRGYVDPNEIFLDIFLNDKVFKGDSFDGIEISYKYLERTHYPNLDSKYFNDMLSDDLSELT